MKSSVYSLCIQVKITQTNMSRSQMLSSCPRLQLKATDDPEPICSSVSPLWVSTLVPKRCVSVSKGVTPSQYNRHMNSRITSKPQAEQEQNNSHWRRAFVQWWKPRTSELQDMYPESLRLFHWILWFYLPRWRIYAKRSYSTNACESAASLPVLL